MLLGTPEFGAYMFRTVMSSWITVPFIRMKCPSLSLLISFTSKSVLFAIRLQCLFLLPGPTWSTFVYPFTLRKCLSLKLRGAFFFLSLINNRWILFLDSSSQPVFFDWKIKADI